MCFNIFFKIVHQKIEKTSQFFKISIFSKKSRNFKKKIQFFNFWKISFFFQNFRFFQILSFFKIFMFFEKFHVLKNFIFFRNFWLFLYFSFLASKILSFHWFWSWCWFHFQHDLWYSKIKTMLSIHFEVCGIFCKQRPDVMLYRSWLWGKRKRVLRVESCCGDFLCYWRGWARTQTPTTRNCTVELPTFAVIAGVSPIWVQWKSLTLEETPLWSDLLPRQVSMLFPAKICKYAT